MPPLIKRKSDLTGIQPEQYFLQSFFKGKVFCDINNAAIKTGVKELVQLDFFLKCNNFVNRMMVAMEDENGAVDFAEAQKRWEAEFPGLVKEGVEANKKEKAGSE
jgi:hypothetical protein